MWREYLMKYEVRPKQGFYYIYRKKMFIWRKGKRGYSSLGYAIKVMRGLQYYDSVYKR